MRVANVKRIEAAVQGLVAAAEELVHRGFGPDEIREALEQLFKEMEMEEEA